MGSEPVQSFAELMRGALRADLVVALGSTLSVTPAANVPLEAASVRKKPW